MELDTTLNQPTHTSTDGPLYNVIAMGGLGCVAGSPILLYQSKLSNALFTRQHDYTSSNLWGEPTNLSISS